MYNSIYMKYPPKANKQTNYTDKKQLCNCLEQEAGMNYIKWDLTAKGLKGKFLNNRKVLKLDCGD